MVAATGGTANSCASAAHDGLRDGCLLEFTPVGIPAQYNLYALWLPGSAERVAGVVVSLLDNQPPHGSGFK